MTTADPANAGQRSNWDGDGGAFWAARAERFDEGVAAYQEPFLAAAAIEPDSLVLDVGCGNGRTTLDAARRAAGGSALGVDLSARMLDVARDRAEREGVPNTRFLQADAQVHPFPADSFDVVVSRHGAMFFDDPAAAFAGIGRALRPDGRLALLTWQPLAEQEWLRTFLRVLAAGRDLPGPPSSGPGPFGLGDPVHVREVLAGAGFVDVELTGLVEPMYYGPDPDDACRFVASQQAGMLRDLDPATRATALDALRADMADHVTDGGVAYRSACWLVTARMPD